jgi:hypothetical protein
VEELTLDLDVDGMRSDRENALDSSLLHELLLPFTGVKKLHIGASLTQELSQVLQSVPGGLSPEPLPELQELKVHLDIYNFYANLNAKKAFSAFVETRKSLGRPVNITVHPQRPPRPTLSSLDAPTLGDPPTFYDPPTFEYVAHPPAPQPLSGSVSHHPPFPVLSAPPRQSAYNSSGPPQSMYEPSTAISIPVHPNPTLSMPYYDSSFPNTAYPPSHPETRMQRGPSYLDVHETVDTSSDEDFEQRPEKRPRRHEWLHAGGGPASPPFAERPRRQWPQETAPTGIPSDLRCGLSRQQMAPVSVPPELPCRLCTRLSPCRDVERLGGFCSERQ